MSTELETQQAAELAAVEALEAEAAASARSSLADERIRVPMIAPVQGTTKNPPKGSTGGDFVNTVTGTVYGPEIEMLIAVYNRGRTYAPKDPETGKRTGEWYVAGPEAIVPNDWPEEFRGRVFAELPEAEETFKRNANDRVHPWGSGPPITTTYNFTGYVVKSAAEDEEPIPVRLSLSRTSTRAARTLITMLKAQRSFWAKAIQLSTKREESVDGPYYVVQVGSYGAEPTLAQRKAAAELHLAAEQLGLAEVGDPEGEHVDSSADEQPASEEKNESGIDF